MPTQLKPSKSRHASKHTVTPGQIWADLSVLYQECCSLLRTGTTAAPILKDPTFIQNVQHLAEVTATAKTISEKLPQYLEQLNALRDETNRFKAEWERLDDLQKRASKARNLRDVNRYREQMDTLEFSALGIGEGYQSWIATWQQDVALDIVKLLNLIELTRRAMAEKENGAK